MIYQGSDLAENVPATLASLPILHALVSFFFMYSMFGSNKRFFSTSTDI